ncbi:MAG: hydrogenase iron-sulfur subunit [Candidatus Altiarchaeota archaeon]
MNKKTDFKPKIIGFLCNWCCYAGADLAGIGRLQYPADVRIVRVMCSARIDSLIIMKAFSEGTDAVFVGGCHPGDCHYTKGNYYSRRRFALTKKILEAAGIEPKRFVVKWISAAEGKEFAEEMEKLSKDVTQLGPLNLKEASNG